jgi:RND family efflux transporter MFP subunit
VGTFQQALDGSWEGDVANPNDEELFTVRLPSAVLAFFVLVLSGCSHRSPAPVAERSVPVQLRAPLLIDRSELVSVSGTVNSPDAPSDVPFLVSGRVVQVAAHEGDFVRRGQLLAVLDSTDYTLAVSGADAQVAAANVARNRAEDEFRRMKQLYESKSLPVNDFHKFEAAYNSASEQLNQAVAGAKEACKRLSDTTLVAPVTGFISRRAIEPGNMAAAGVPAFQIVTLDPIEVLVGVPETSIHLVRAGQKVQIRIPALPGESFEGTIREINVAADSSTRSYSTRIRVANSQHRLRVGMIAEAEIQGDQMIKAITVPASAIARDPQGATLAFVYYPAQKRVFSKRIETGRVVGEEVEIRSGVQADEQVVIGGQHELRDGSLVEPAASLPAHLAVAGTESK